VQAYLGPESPVQRGHAEVGMPGNIGDRQRRTGRPAEPADREQAGKADEH